MNKTEKILMERYDKIEETLLIMTPGNDGYQSLLEEQDKLRNEMIKLEQIHSEAENKKAEIEAENKRETKRNLITIATSIATISISIWTICKSFKFDETSTLTSTIGKGAVTSVIPKIFKK